ncbi:Uma2 family endonuclease [Spirulina sp. CCNP1310]|uniref:Uma2 family endonuclease n=1 Tax=Spirulina sp. CCNP1310 TaxID=3110249 RepID=UPI002B214519|nr:Uma2 family endonuclease [Spirulina sp. CCNP1310]MEA5417605.1 Uma2 family endonuclease [Spirulina sp. CCNP1310]
MVLAPPTLTLEQFLTQPETKPAQEYIEGAISPKPMPQGRHSRLQAKLCAAINQAAETEAIAAAFPELRCTCGDIAPQGQAQRSLVPDIAVFRWARIPFTAEGDVCDRFSLAPDWTIEILSTDQSPNRVIGNILYLMRHGTELGWFIDPEDRSILVFTSQQEPELFTGAMALPCLPDIPLSLTATQVFRWLQMAKG